MQTELSVRPQAVVFEDDPDAEHALIVRAQQQAAVSGWELGARLLRFKETGEWAKVTVGGTYKTFTDYLSRGVAVHPALAYEYMRAAQLPKEAVLKFGMKSCAVLSQILELTQAEETLQEALTLSVEADDGALRPFAELTLEERQRALARLVRDSGVVRRGRRASAEDETLISTRERLREATGAQLAAGQVQLRRIGGNLVLDLKGIAAKDAAAVFRALAMALRQTSGGVR